MPRPLLLLVLLLSSALGQGLELPEKFFEECEDAASYLAKGHEEQQLQALFELLRELGRDPEELEKLQTKTQRYLGRKQKSKQLPRAIGALEDALEELEAWFVEAPEAVQHTLIPHWLRFDSARTDLYELLGAIACNERWMWPEEAELLDRRAEIAEGVRQAHRFEVPLTTGSKPDRLLQALYGVDEATAVSGFGVRVASVRLSALKLERMLRQTLRALALSQWLYSGALRVPEKVWPHELILLGSAEDYERAVHEAHSQGRLAEADVAQALELSSFYTSDYTVVLKARIEASSEASMLFQLHRNRTQPWIMAGHINWICNAFLGTQGPSVIFTDTLPEPQGGSMDAETIEEWKLMRRLGQAGLSGSRAYMRWLVEHEQDPRLADCMHDQYGKVRGEQLLKATHVVAWLQESGQLRKVWDGTRPGELKGSAAQATADALATTLNELEHHWSRWILPPPAIQIGLLQRLRGETAGEAIPGPVADALKILKKLRASAFKHKPKHTLGWDPELSFGCQAHAEYLGRNPAQLSAWPDAHEEYPDREGFSPEGSIAGLASVIAPGSTGPQDAIDSWMGTWFHRLPLLDPGLMRIGWGLHERVAVLDCGSMVAPADWVATVVWPPPKAKDIPLRFRAELPNPFVGRDQSSWGYPITVQLFHIEAEADARLSLYQGKQANAANLVPCLFSAPDQPGNPELVPANAYCLIPEQPLAANTHYTVVFQRPDAAPLQWGFRTGAR